MIQPPTPDKVGMSTQETQEQTIARLTAENAHLRTALYTCGLTGLPNERALHEALRVREGATVVLADLDAFKAVNDTIGMEAGDAVLRTFADFLRATTRQDEARPSDFVAYRVHGDEFVILTDEAGAAPIRARLDAWEGPHGTSATTGQGYTVDEAGCSMRAHKAPTAR